MIALICLALGLAIATDRLYMFFTVFVPIGVIAAVVQQHRTGGPERDDG